MVPTVALPPWTLFTRQVTAVLLVPVTVAMNCCVAPLWTVAEVGAMVTVMGAVIVTIVEADFEESATLVAVTVNRKRVGKGKGVDLGGGRIIKKKDGLPPWTLFRLQ